jgi:hypothetical protein
MPKKYYSVIKTVKQEVVLVVDESIKPDDDYRQNFYDHHTLEDMAEHIAHNVLTFGRDYFVEGVGDPGDKTFRVISVDHNLEDEFEAEEITQEQAEQWVDEQNT